jgi:hypothetical protein
MNLNTFVLRFFLADRKLTGELTVEHQREDAFTYDGERRVRIVADRRTREAVRALGDRLYVWRSSAGLVQADVSAPPGQVQFDHLRSDGSFDLFLDRDLYLEGLVVRHRRAVRPRFYLQRFPCEP